MKVTIKKLASSLGVSYVDARGLVTILLKTGDAKVVGQERSAVRGKPSSIYEVPENLKVQLPHPDFKVFELPETADLGSCI